MSNEKIWFTGSHGTGKTTQVDYFLEFFPNFNRMQTQRRELFDKGIININREAAPWDEIVIAGDVMTGILSTSAPFISDRSWIDKMAYASQLPYAEEVLDALHTLFTNAYPGFTDNDYYFYFPCGILEIEDDGVRSTNIEYQKAVDMAVQFYLNYHNVPFHTVMTHNIADRHIEICNIVFGDFHWREM